MTSPIKAGDDVALDLAWLLLTGRGFRSDTMDLARKREKMKQDLPCMLTGLRGKETQSLKAKQKKLRADMKKLGFYKGSLRRRPDAYLRRKIRALKGGSAAARRGRAVKLIVYTRVASSQCGKDASEYDRARCAYARTARARARGSSSTRAVGVQQSDSLAAVWAKIARNGRGRTVTSLSVMDHGSTDAQVIGADRMTSSTAVPASVANLMARGARVTLYGCDVGKATTPGAQSGLADNLGRTLLRQGGSVRVLKREAKLTSRLKEPKRSDWVTYRYTACNPGRALSDALSTISEMVNAGTKVAATTSLPAAPKATASLPGDMKQYPDTVAYVDAGSDPSDYPAVG